MKTRAAGSVADKMKYCLAIDIGASSGRHIVGWQEDGELKTEEVYRFRNGVSEENGHLVWDVDHLLKEVKAGIEKAGSSDPAAVAAALHSGAPVSTVVGDLTYAKTGDLTTPTFVLYKWEDGKAAEVK